MSVGKERCLNAFVRRKKQIKFAVCSRSVANRVYLTNHRPKKRKVIMHHTQGLEQYLPNETMSFPRSLQSAKIAPWEKCVFESSLKNTETQQGGLRGEASIYIACGYTDLRREIDGLAQIIQKQAVGFLFQQPVSVCAAHSYSAQAESIISRSQGSLP